MDKTLHEVRIIQCDEEEEQKVLLYNSKSN